MERHKIEQTTPEHVYQVAMNIRKPDLDELWATTMQRPYDIMMSALNSSDAVFTGFVDDEPVCVWGVASESLLFNTGVPWMVSTKAIDKHAIQFIRHCRAEVMKMFEKYDSLENYVDARNKNAVRWLKWLGFTIDDPKPYGAFNLPFHRFWMENKDV